MSEERDERAAPPMAERHAGAARLIQNRIIGRVANMTPEDVAKLPVRDLIALWNDSVTIEQRSASSDDLARSVGLDP